jgi:hypothetical protein
MAWGGVGAFGGFLEHIERAMQPADRVSRGWLPAASLAKPCEMLDGCRYGIQHRIQELGSH